MKSIFKTLVLPVIALAIGLSSCKKNETEKDLLLKGGDLDHPIIVGVVKSSSLEPVNNSKVKLYESEGAFYDSTYADAQGEFSFINVDEGSYYLEAYDGIELLTTTNNFNVQDSTYIEVIED